MGAWRPANRAILIDPDHTQPAEISALRIEVDQVGTATVKRAYGAGPQQMTLFVQVRGS